MRNIVTVQGGVSTTEIEIAPGEDLQVALVWLNSDGSTKSMIGHTVTFRLTDSTGAVTYNGTLVSSALLDIAGAITASWAQGWYVGELLDNDGTGDVSAGTWDIRVYVAPADRGPYETVAEVLNAVAQAVGLSENADPVASSDPRVKQMVRLLITAARELVGMRNWTQLIRERSFITVAGDTGVYDLPSDFHRLIPSTLWDRTAVTEGAPVGAISWQYLKAQAMGLSLQAIFRIAQRQIWLYPQPPTAGMEITFEYITRNWLMSAGAPRPDLEVPVSSDDLVCFDPSLIEAAVKLAWLENKGFDTTAALSEFNRAYEAAANSDDPGQVLYTAPGQGPGFHLIDGWNVPDTGFGVP